MKSPLKFTIKNFLKPGQLTQADENIKKLASSLKDKSAEKTLQNVIDFVRNLNYYDLENKELKRWKKIFLQRNAGQILKSNVSYGCDDHTILFVTLARELGFPTKYLTAKRLGKPGMHAWPRVYLKEKWLDINATTGEISFDYEKTAHGPYKILSESLDPADSVMKNYQDWIKVEEKFQR